ncbi:MAG: WHG domain-containing protein [Alphaproteobacteria bacterium]|nr:WHG domain-containing protein [Alphaproteobacteria bacterium]
MARRYDHTREEIMQMAIESGNEMIAEHGLAVFSARGLAKTIGYTVGTLHNVFGGYDMLVMRINAHTLDELQQYIRNKTLNIADGEDSIRAMAHAYYQFAKNAPLRWRAIFEHSLPENATIPDWYQQKTVDLFIEIEIHMKAVNPKGDARLAAKSLWAGIHGTCALALTGKLDLTSKSSTEQLLEAMLDNFIRGYESRP